jgi:type I restriction enzyme M protein
LDLCTAPAKLTRVVSLIQKEGPWTGIGVDVKGQIYEGLLENLQQNSRV